MSSCWFCRSARENKVTVILQRIGTPAFYHEGIKINVCYSSGSAHYQYTGDASETLLARADEQVLCKKGCSHLHSAESTDPAHFRAGHQSPSKPCTVLAQILTRVLWHLEPARFWVLIRLPITFFTALRISRPCRTDGAALLGTAQPSQLCLFFFDIAAMNSSAGVVYRLCRDFFYRCQCPTCPHRSPTQQ